MTKENQAAAIVFEHASRRCIFCGHVEGRYDTGDKFCVCPGCRGNLAYNHKLDPRYHVAAVPWFDTWPPKPPAASAGRHGRRQITRKPSSSFERLIEKNLPLADAAKRVDGFVVGWAPKGDAGVMSLSDEVGVPMPYTSDILARKFGLRLGNPSLWRPIEGFGRMQNVTSLDFSTYAISRTLKDPKTYSMMNCGLELGVKHFAIYSEGNAAMSAACLASLINRQVPNRNDHLHVYAVVREGLGERVKAELRMAGATVVDDVGEITRPDRKGYALDESAVWRHIERVTNRHIDPEHRWHCSDGFEGVGFFFYYLLWRQLLRPIDGLCTYRHVIVPVGTGNLFCALLLAARDLYEGSAAGPNLYAAVPAGMNTLINCPTVEQRSGNQASPLAGKLWGTFSPLQPFLEEAFDQKAFRVITVGLRDQVSALHALAGSPEKVDLQIECSGVVAWAALMKLSNNEWFDSESDGKHYDHYNLDEPVLVASTGNGLVPDNEADLMTQALLSRVPINIRQHSVL